MTPKTSFPFWKKKSKMVAPPTIKMELGGVECFRINVNSLVFTLFIQSQMHIITTKHLWDEISIGTELLFKEVYTFREIQECKSIYSLFHIWQKSSIFIIVIVISSALCIV